MRFKVPPFPSGYKPDPSAMSEVFGFMVFCVMFVLIWILSADLSKERKLKSIKENSPEPKPGSRKLGAYRGEIWIADDFDAPLSLVADRPKRKRRKR